MMIAGIDFRYALTLVVTLIGVFCICVAGRIAWKRVRLRHYIMSGPQSRRTYVGIVRLTENQERVASTGEVIQAFIRLVKAVAILVLAGITWFGSAVPLAVRQWTYTVCILTLVVGLALILLNEIRVDGRLEKDARNDPDIRAQEGD